MISQPMSWYLRGGLALTGADQLCLFVSSGPTPRLPARSRLADACGPSLAHPSLQSRPARSRLAVAPPPPSLPARQVPATGLHGPGPPSESFHATPCCCPTSSSRHMLLPLAQMATPPLLSPPAGLQTPAQVEPRSHNPHSHYSLLCHFPACPILSLPELP